MSKKGTSFPLTAQDIQAANLILNEKMSYIAIAKAVGMHRNVLERRRALPAFKKYLADRQAKDIQIIEGQKDKELAKFAPQLGGRAEVLALLWKWATIEPEGNNIEPQRKALADYREMNGMGPAAGDSEGAPEAPDVYQAEWMREAKPN